MDKLTKIRKEMGYNNSQMANLLGISKAYYWQIEHKQRNLSYKMAFKIGKILKMKPDELFYDEFEKDLA